MLIIITAVSALVPSLLLIWYFYAKDLEREPGRVLWATFGLGVATVIPVLMVAVPIGSALKAIRDPYLHGSLDAFLAAAIPEEFFKLLVLLFYSARHKEFDEPMDGIVYGAIASLGFATLENVLYVGKGGLGVAVLRAVTAVPGHAFLGAIMGYYVGQAKFTPARRVPLVLTGYFVAVLLHGLYDLPLLILKELQTAHKGDAPTAAVSLVIVTLAALVLEWLWTLRLLKRLRADQQQVLLVRASLAGQPPPSAALPPRRSGALSWVMLVSGGLLATAGGLVVLTLVAALVFSPADKPDTTGAIIAGGAIIGGLPLVLGVVLFALGVRRLAAAKAPVPVIQGVEMAPLPRRVA